MCICIFTDIKFYEQLYCYGIKACSSWYFQVGRQADIAVFANCTTAETLQPLVGKTVSTFVVIFSKFISLPVFVGILIKIIAENLLMEVLFSFALLLITDQQNI